MEPRTHAVLESTSRRRKAQKIMRVLELHGWAASGKRVLDIGTGSGEIAQAFAAAVGAKGSVDTVDVVDQRLLRQGVTFRLVDGPALPYPDDTFDLVLSNHVIEHVGNYRDQLFHLHEIRRVLRASGICYLATPNRWAVIEPHFRLPLLSWLPNRASSAYVRLTRKGEFYDCRMLSGSELEAAPAEAGLLRKEVTSDALTIFVQVESPSPAVRALSLAPRSLLTRLEKLSPTRIFLLTPGDLP